MGSVLSELFFINPADDAYGLLQILFLGCVYACILLQGSNMIQDGSELLLLVPKIAGVVGSVVLPVLGAVPDGAIVLFSGLGKHAKKQIQVGIGALAGSTIMLLTIPWALSIWAGRVDMDEHGKGNYVKPKKAPNDWKKLGSPRKILGTGVNCSGPIRYSSKVMLVTTLPFFIIQVPALFGHCTIPGKPGCHTPNLAALVACIFAGLLFFFYLWDHARIATLDGVNEDHIDEIRAKAVKKGRVSLRGLFPSSMKDEYGHVVEANPDCKRFQNFLKPFFRRFDADGSGSIDREEFILLAASLGEKFTPFELDHMYEEMDKDGNGVIDFQEFCTAMSEMLAHGTEMARPEHRRHGTFGGDGSPLHGTPLHGSPLLKTHHRDDVFGSRVFASGSFESSARSSRRGSLQRRHESRRGSGAGGGDNTVARVVNFDSGPLGDETTTLLQSQSSADSSAPSSPKKQVRFPSDPPANDDPLGQSQTSVPGSESPGSPLVTLLQASRGNIGGGPGHTCNFQSGAFSPLRRCRSMVKKPVREESDSDESEDEESEIPDDLAHLTPEQQQRRIILRSCWQMGAGGLIVLLFSDPMVDILTKLGDLSGIPSFYVAFILAPVAANAPELIGVYASAITKTQKTMDIAFSSIIGAVVMNNTFVLAILLFQVYYIELAWDFSVKTLSVLLVEFVMFGFCQLHAHHTWYAGAVLALMPLSLALIAGLDYVSGDKQGLSS